MPVVGTAQNGTQNKLQHSMCRDHRSGSIAMQRYTIQIGDGDTGYEIANLVLADTDCAKEVTIRFVSELFSSRPELFTLTWNECSIQVFSEDGEEVFATTAARAALIERDEIRAISATMVDN
ncbi:MAG TPA: hypothetical protein VFY53_08425 [Rhodoplanes sp.]|nr:hypothetical protein [Rhodoplanes sp.]